MITVSNARPLVIVGLASEGGYVADGTCVLCSDCLARRRAENDFEHHLGDDAAVLLDGETETDADVIDVCEDCDAPNVLGLDAPSF